MTRRILILAVLAVLAVLVAPPPTDASPWCWPLYEEYGDCLECCVDATQGCVTYCEGNQPCELECLSGFSDCDEGCQLAFPV